VAPNDWAEEIAQREKQLNVRDLPLAYKGRPPHVIALVQYLKDHHLYDPVLDGLRSAVEYDKTYFDKIVASLLPLLEKLTTGKTAELIAPNYFDSQDHRPMFDWRQIIRRNGIVYVGLDALSDTTVASAVGNSMFADLVSVAGQLYKHGLQEGLPALAEPMPKPMIAVHADEFNELIGEEFIPLLNKAGGAGFQVTAYTQTWSDVEARLGNRAKAGQVAGNFNTLIMLRVKEIATAELLTEQLPRVEIFSLMQVSGTNDSSDPNSPVDFTSRNEDRISVSEVPLLTPADLVALPKGQAFAFSEGGQLWKLRLPLTDTRRDPVMPDNLQQIAEAMARRYKTGERWWQETPLPPIGAAVATATGENSAETAGPSADANPSDAIPTVAPQEHDQ
jgi:conjugative coupling factor TraD (TOL family)